MFTILAQSGGQETQTSEQSASSLPEIFSRFDALAHPDQLVEMLSQLSWVVAAILVAVGLVSILQGYKLYKWIVLLVAAGLGVVVGRQLGAQIDNAVVVAGALGVLLAVVAWPFMKFAVSACGGLAGAFIGANCWTAIASQVNNSGAMNLPPDAYWAGALMGLILFGMLSFILFEVSVVVFTSFSGSVLAVLGIVALLLQIESMQQAVADSLKANPLVMPLLVIVPAVVGLVIQHGFGGMKRQEGKA